MRPLPDRNLVLKKIQDKKRKFVLRNTVINELSFLEYPQHRTAVYTISEVSDPDYVVIYTYGGYHPHFFHETEHNEIDELGMGQFTWEWLGHWLEQKVAIVIVDMPDYYQHSMFVPSLYRFSNDRKREITQVVDVVKTRFPSSNLAWAGFSFGCAEATTISLEETQLDKVVLCSGTWHTLEGFDEWHQGARLDWYNVTDCKKPVLIVQHEKEKFEKATEQMSLTDSITVANMDVSKDDGHFFKDREKEVATSIVSWLRNKEFPKEIL